MSGKSRTDIETIGARLVHHRETGSGDEAFLPSSAVVASLPQHRMSTAGRRQACVIAGVETDSGAAEVVVVVYGYTPLAGRQGVEGKHQGQWLRRVLAHAVGTLGEAEIDAGAGLPNMVLAESFEDADLSESPYTDFLAAQYGRGPNFHDDGEDGIGEIGVGDLGNTTDISVHAWATNGSDPSEAKAWAFITLGD